MDRYLTKVEIQERRILNLRANKAERLKNFSTDVKGRVNKVIDDLLCEQIFNFHMDLKLGILDPRWFSIKRPDVENELIAMANRFNINKGSDDVPCPSCHVPVKCHWLSKHLAICVKPEQCGTLSYSSRNSSRIARQRIQEGFRTSYDDSKGDSDDDGRSRGKKRLKPKKTKVKGVK